MSGGGGGVIILRAAMKRALLDPLVHGELPDYIAYAVDPVLAKSINDWTAAEHHAVTHGFLWAAGHCQ
jgi:hypothetical protein